MKSRCLTCLTAVLMAAISVNPVLAGQMPDSSGSGSYVKTISITAIKPYPVIEVKSNGEKYTGVENADQEKTFNAQVTGVCRSTKYVYFAGYNLAKTKYSSGTVAHKNLEVSGSKHKTFGTNKRVDIQWRPDSSVNSRAVQTCRDYMQNAKNNGQSLIEILGKDHRMVVDSGVYGNFNLNCSGLIAAGVKHRFDMQPMEVVCKGSPVKMSLDLNKAELFRIKSVGFAPMKPTYTGSCPKDFKFVGMINTDGSGKLRYRFRYDSGAISPWETVTIKNSTGYHLHHTIKLQDAKTIDPPNLPNQIQNQQGNGIGQIPQLGGLQQNPWVTLEVENLATHKKYLEKATYKYTCVQPPKRQVSKLNPAAGKADLIVLADTFQLGSKTASGNRLVIGADEASRKIGGKCQFRSQVKIENQGQGDANELFGTRINSNGVTPLIDNLTGLKKGQTGTVSGNLMLPAGNSTLLIKTDHANKVDESNEGNNLARIMVTVKGDCGSNTPPRPGSNNSNPPRPAEPTGASARPIR